MEKKQWLTVLGRVLREVVPATAGAVVVALSAEGVLPPVLADALQGLLRALFGL